MEKKAKAEAKRERRNKRKQEALRAAHEPDAVPPADQESEPDDG